MDKETDNKEQKDFLVLKTPKGLIRIAFEDTLYIECEDFFCVLTMAEGNRYSISQPLAHFTEKLKKTGFSLANRSLLVNLRHVASLQRINSRKWLVVMKDGNCFNIAYRRLKSFKDDYCNIASVK